MNTSVKDRASDAPDSSSLEHFLNAIRNFRQQYYTDEPETMQALLTHGQSPKVLMIACSDSRVEPALLVNAEPGDLFVVRNVANLVPPYCVDDRHHGVGAAIEYAVRDLKVEHIIIMGHAHCGGIKALLNRVSGERQERDFIGNWVSIAEEACHHLIGSPAGEGRDPLSVDQIRDYPCFLERAAIDVSLKNLLTYPWLRERVEARELHLHGWWFDLESGDLWATDPETGCFMPAT